MRQPIPDDAALRIPSRLPPRLLASLLLPGLLVCGCAHNEADLAARDPAAPTNRTIFAGNLAVDRNVLRPTSRFYVNDVPKGVRRSVHSFGENLKEPEIFANDLLQGNLGRGLGTLGRFTINTTVGGLGLFDVAQGWGLPYHDADFGQTFGVWGIGPGPDVQLPLLGFSNVRDTTGKVVGAVADPFNLLTGNVFQIVNGANSGLGVIDGRASTLALTDDVERSSLDEYATLRSITSQNRAAFIREGARGHRGAPKPAEAMADARASPDI